MSDAGAGTSPPRLSTDGASLAGVAWVGLGSNVGRRDTALARLRGELGTDGVTLAAVSRLLLTRPLGPAAQRDFLNQVVRLEAVVPMAVEAWLGRLQAAERAAGRGTGYRWGPRRADADILLLGADGAIVVHAGAVEVPHPELARRPFFCALLAELAPGLRHPDGRLLGQLGGRFAAPSRDHR